MTIFLKNIRRIATACLVVLVILAFAQIAEACPTCKDGINDPSRAGMVRGYFWSIIFMMSMPFLILGGLSSYFYYEICKARRKAQLSAEEALVANAVSGS